MVVEKTGLYSFLILFSLGITRGKVSSMVDALVDFKTDYDRNAPLARTLPSLARRERLRAGWGLRDLCDALHACYRDNDTAVAMNAMYRPAEPAMTPSVAYDHRLHGRVEPVATTPEGPRDGGDGRALPARHPADHARRALHRSDHRLPGSSRATPTTASRLRGRHPRPALRRRQEGPQDLAGRLREGSLRR